MKVLLIWKKEEANVQKGQCALCREKIRNIEIIKVVDFRKRTIFLSKIIFTCRLDFCGASIMPSFFQEGVEVVSCFLSQPLLFIIVIVYGGSCQVLIKSNKRVSWPNCQQLPEVSSIKSSFTYGIACQRRSPVYSLW